MYPEVPHFGGLDAVPKVLRLRGGMQSSWDVIAGWRQDLEVHRGLIREGVDLDYSIASILAIAEDAILRFESTEDAFHDSVAGAERTTQQLDACQHQLEECRRELEGERHLQVDLRSEVQRLKDLLVEVKEQVGKLMIEGGHAANSAAEGAR